MNYLSALINAGGDAHSNLYVVKFTAPEALSTELDDLAYLDNAFTIRCSGIEIPTIEHASYPVKFVTATIDRPSAKINIDRTLTFTFRVDANFKAYSALLRIQKQYFNPVTHQINAHIDSKQFFKIEAVYLKDANDTSSSFGGNSSGQTSDFYTGTVNTGQLIATFKDCWITNITGLSFNTDQSNPVSVSVTVKFKSMIEEMENLI